MNEYDVYAAFEKYLDAVVEMEEAAWKASPTIRRIALNVAFQFGHEWVNSTVLDVGDFKAIEDYRIAKERLLLSDGFPSQEQISLGCTNSEPGIRHPGVHLDSINRALWSVYGHETMTGRTNIQARQVVKSSGAEKPGKIVIEVTIGRPTGDKAMGEIIITPGQSPRYISNVMGDPSSFYTRHQYAWQTAWECIVHIFDLVIPQFPAKVQAE